MIDPVTGRKRCSAWPYCQGTSGEPRMLRSYGMLCPRCYRIIPRAEKRRRQALHRRGRWLVRWYRHLAHGAPRPAGPPPYPSALACRRAAAAVWAEADAMWLRFVNEARIARALGVDSVA